jgi:hypothetical protein
MTGGIGLGSILTTLQQGVTAINNLAGNIKTVFPQITGSSTKAPSTAGAITFTSSEALGFQLVTLSSGVTVKVPFYPQ